MDIYIKLYSEGDRWLPFDASAYEFGQVDEGDRQVCIEVPDEQIASACARVPTVQGNVSDERAP